MCFWVDDEVAKKNAIVMKKAYAKHKVMGDYDFEINPIIFNKEIVELLKMTSDDDCD